MLSAPASESLIVMWIGMDVALHRCCRCNRTAKCVYCSCAKSSRSCSSCLPGDHGKCLNRRDQNRRLNNDTHASRLLCSRTAQKDEEVAKEVGAVLKTVMESKFSRTTDPVHMYMRKMGSEQ